MEKSVNEDQILTSIRNPKTVEKGFRMLVTRYQERIYWHVRKMVLSHEDANDIVQNTFVKAFKGISRFKGDSKIYTWLYRIATNESITFLNKKKKQQTWSGDNTVIYVENNLKADPFFEGDEIKLELQKALATLPVKQKLVFNMRYFDELSYKEISEILETSEGALKASYHHAVKKIEHYFHNVKIF